MPYKPTKERQAYLDRHEPRSLPIEGDVIQIGRYRGKTTDYENVRDFKLLAASEATEL